LAVANRGTPPSRPPDTPAARRAPPPRRPPPVLRDRRGPRHRSRLEEGCDPGPGLRRHRAPPLRRTVRPRPVAGTAPRRRGGVRRIPRDLVHGAPVRAGATTHDRLTPEQKPAGEKHPAPYPRPSDTQSDQMDTPTSPPSPPGRRSGFPQHRVRLLPGPFPPSFSWRAGPSPRRAAVDQEE